MLLLTRDTIKESAACTLQRSKCLVVEVVCCPSSQLVLQAMLLQMNRSGATDRPALTRNTYSWMEKFRGPWESLVPMLS